MAENKVQFGLKNVYYALLTEGATNTWTTPVAVPGAVNLTLSQNGESTDFYADNVTYYKTIVNNGYTGSLEIARVPDEMLIDIFGLEQDTTSKVLFEKTGVEPAPFALLFEIDGDADQECYCFYRCIANRPDIEGATDTNSKEVKTATLEISCLPLVTGTANQQGLIKARTTADTPAATKTAWFTSVTVPGTNSNDNQFGGAA